VAAAKKKWTIATARQYLPELMRLAAREPQQVYRRDRLVAAVVSPELADEVQRLRRPGIAAKLAELQRLCAEDSYELTVPARQDRANPLDRRRGGGRSRARPGRKR
jgi:hypothetical protein